MEDTWAYVSRASSVVTACSLTFAPSEESLRPTLPTMTNAMISCKRLQVSGLSRSRGRLDAREACSSVATGSIESDRSRSRAFDLVKGNTNLIRDQRAIRVLGDDFGTGKGTFARAGSRDSIPITVSRLSYRPSAQRSLSTSTSGLVGQTPM